MTSLIKIGQGITKLLLFEYFNMTNIGAAILNFIYLLEISWIHTYIQDEYIYMYHWIGRRHSLF